MLQTPRPLIDLMSSKYGRLSHCFSVDTKMGIQILCHSASLTTKGTSSHQYRHHYCVLLVIVISCQHMLVCTSRSSISSEQRTAQINTIPKPEAKCSRAKTLRLCQQQSGISTFHIQGFNRATATDLPEVFESLSLQLAQLLLRKGLQKADTFFQPGRAFLRRRTRRKFV